MNAIIRNILAVVAGILIGGGVNMTIITAGPSVIPLPEGVDPSDMESLKSNMHLFKPRHFLPPFLAHALGTLAGAFMAYLIAERHKMRFAIAIGFFFLAGGIYASAVLPAPVWFIAADLAGAYLPFAALGGGIAERIGRRAS